MWSRGVLHSLLYFSFGHPLIQFVPIGGVIPFKQAGVRHSWNRTENEQGPSQQAMKSRRTVARMAIHDIFPMSWKWHPIVPFWRRGRATGVARAIAARDSQIAC